MIRRGLPLALGCFALGCGESGAQGNSFEIDFGDASVVSFDAAPDVGAGGDDAGPDDAGGDANPDADADVVQPIVHEEPVVDSFAPETGPWGVQVRIDGTDLGSAQRAASLWVGDGPALEPGDSPDIVSWSETRVVLRVAFPGAGVVTLETDEGSVDAGEFTPSFVASEPFELDDGEKVLASASLAPDHVAVLINSDPLTVAEFDSGAWTSSELPDVAVREDSLALYGDSNGALAAVALSATTPPEIVTYTLDSGTWSEQMTGLEVTDSYAIAGAVDGAVVWYFDADGWYRVRPIDDVWQQDKGPIDNPYENTSLNQVMAMSDGALITVRSKNTGNLLDETGAPFVRFFEVDDDVFGPESRAGDHVDDYLTSIELFSRGRGVVIEYCALDESVGGGGRTNCYWATFRQNGGLTRRSIDENEFNRHAFTPTSEALLRCDSDLGSIAANDPNTEDVWVWPCLEHAAFEVDPAGTLIPVFLYEGALVVVSER